MNEELIRQVASEISNKLLTGAPPVQLPARAAHTLLIFGEEANNALRASIMAACPGAHTAQPGSVAEEQFAACTTLVLVAPSLDLASKISLLQTDCAIASLVIRALFANKRVLAVAEGILAEPANLRAGLQRALADLRGKLTDLGIEIVSTEELGTLLAASRPAPAHTATPVKAVTRSASLPVLPASQHPSQQRMHHNDALSEFLEFLQTKQCTMEKGKPCDNCDICNTMGF